jgi:hypothetical protein
VSHFDPPGRGEARSIPLKAGRRLDRRDLVEVEIEIDNRLQRFTGRALA